MTVSVRTSVAHCSSTRVPASIRPRCSSASASRVVVRLTKYTAAPIDTTASAALARKIRLVSDPRMVTRLSQGEIRLDSSAGVRDDDRPRFTNRAFVPCDQRVAPGRDAANLVSAVDRRDGEVPMVEDKDERAHM